LQYATDLKRLEQLGLVRKGTVVLADNVVFPGAPELLAYLGVPFVVSTDDASGQECLAAPAAAALPTAAYVNHGWKSRLLSVPFEYRPLTPDAVSYSERL
jgi:predicted O-methyltransferase YrrM